MVRIALLVLALTPVARAQDVIPASAVTPVNPSVAKVSPRLQPTTLAARRAMDYLVRNHTMEGGFVYGHMPALRSELDGDNFISQAEAVIALSRAARYFKDAEATATAKHALLKLIDATTLDDAKKLRHSALPDRLLSRIAASGTLLAAIHEVPMPRPDLLDAGDQLALYLASQMEADGSFPLAGEHPNEKKHRLEFTTGPALYGIVKSHTHRPAAWKLDAARKSCEYYVKTWQGAKSQAMIPSHTDAYAQAYRLTKDPIFRDAVFQMNDWLGSLQYKDGRDLGRQTWVGGFPHAGREGEPPDAMSARYAGSLAQACMVARMSGDVTRHGQYQVALERSLQFLTRLQYTESRVSHFATWYQTRILGGFFTSSLDGNIRLDQVSHGLAALVDYLEDQDTSP